MEHVLARFHGLLPGLTTDILTLIDRLLPNGSTAETSRSSGRASRNWLSRALTSLGERPTHEYHQYLNREEQTIQTPNQAERV